MADSSPDDVRWAFEVGEPVGYSYNYGPAFVITDLQDKGFVSVSSLHTKTRISRISGSVFVRQRMSFAGPVTA